MRHPALACLLISLVFASCQKEVIGPGTPSTTTTTTTGGGTGSGGSGGGTGGGGGTTVTDSSYMPLVVGNWWKLKDSATGNVQTATITSNQHVFNGLAHRSAFVTPTTVPGTDSIHYYHDQTDYYYSFVVPTASGNSPTTILYLKDTTAGTTWTMTAGTLNGLTATIDGVTVARNLTMTVNGTTYRQVIHSYFTLSYPFIGVAASYDMYSAKGIGIIQSLTTSMSGPGGGTTTRINQSVTTYYTH